MFKNGPKLNYKKKQKCYKTSLFLTVFHDFRSRFFIFNVSSQVKPQKYRVLKKKNKKYDFDDFFYDFWHVFELFFAYISQNVAKTHFW